MLWRDMRGVTLGQGSGTGMVTLSYQVPILRTMASRPVASGSKPEPSKVHVRTMLDILLKKKGAEAMCIVRAVVNSQP